MILFRKLNQCQKIYTQIYSMSFFELSPVDYVKELINIKNAVENKENVAVIKDRISGLKDWIK